MGTGFRSLQQDTQPQNPALVTVQEQSPLDRLQPTNKKGPRGPAIPEQMHVKGTKSHPNNFQTTKGQPAVLTAAEFCL